MQVFYAKYLDAIDNAGSDAAYLTCVTKADACQQLSRGLSDGGHRPFAVGKQGIGILEINLGCRRVSGSKFIRL